MIKHFIVWRNWIQPFSDTFHYKRVLSDLTFLERLSSLIAGVTDLPSQQNVIGLVLLPTLKKVGHFRPLFIYYCLFNTLVNKQVNKQMFNKILLMTGVEPRASGIKSDCSTHWATTTSHDPTTYSLLHLFVKIIDQLMNPKDNSSTL